LFLTLSDAFAFRAFWFVVCFSISTTAFQYRALPAFPPIKHEKREKQRAIFLKRHS